MQWEAYNVVEPFGAPADDQRFGLLAQMTISPHMPAGSRMKDAEEFFPWYRKPDPVLLSADDMAAEFDRVFH